MFLQYATHINSKNTAMTVLALVFVLLHFSPVSAQSKATFDKRLIAAEKRVIWEAVAKKQINVLQSSLAQDYLDVSDVGIFTKTETLQLIPNLTLRDYSLDKFKVIKLDKNSAIITYEAIQHWTIRGQEAPSHV